MSRTGSRLGNAAVTGAEGVKADVSNILRVHSSTAEVTDTLRAVPVVVLGRSPWQPRTRVDADPAAFAALVESVRVHGILEPLLARELACGALELLAGERRLESAKAAGLETVPVRVLRGLDDSTARAIALAENLARQDLSAWETAQALAALRQARREAGAPVGVRELAAAVGRDRTTTGHLLAVGERLTPEVVDAARRASRSHAVRNPDSLPLTALYGAAKAETEAERVRLLALALKESEAATDASPAPAGPRSPADAPPLEAVAFRLTGSLAKRVAFRLERPVETLDPPEASAVLEALAPLLKALRRKAKGTL